MHSNPGCKVNNNKMKLAITGGNGFLGRHLANALSKNGHIPSLLVRSSSKASFPSDNIEINEVSLLDKRKLTEIFAACNGVAHLAGINREVEGNTFQKAHIEATQTVVDACVEAGLEHLLFISFLRARNLPDSAYHNSKWAAEELIRKSNLRSYTILKPGMIFGRGDHMLTHLELALNISPFFGPVGLDENANRVSPIYIEDMVKVMEASFSDPRLARKTFAVTGPESLPLKEVVKRVAKAMNKPCISIPLPVSMHLIMANLLEATMKNPLVTVAQIKMLMEGMDEGAVLPDSEQLPSDLQPKTYLTGELISAVMSEKA